MKFEKGKDIPVGTVVYKAAWDKPRLDKSGWNDATKRQVVLTMIVTKPGFCNNDLYERWNKCRVREVLVTKIEYTDREPGGKKALTEAYSNKNVKFKYTLYGKRGTKFDTRKDQACAGGIHCFLTKTEARAYLN
jgi:hypothetical protein